MKNFRANREKFIEMMAFGCSPGDIQNELTMSPNIFLRWADAYWDEIENLKSLFIEIIEQYNMRSCGNDN